MFTIFCRFAKKHLVRLDSYFLCFVFIKLWCLVLKGTGPSFTDETKTLERK